VFYRDKIFINGTVLYGQIAMKIQSQEADSCFLKKHLKSCGNLWGNLSVYSQL